jgi:hypothetical protein
MYQKPENKFNLVKSVLESSLTLKITSREQLHLNPLCQIYSVGPAQQPAMLTSGSSSSPFISMPPWPARQALRPFPKGPFVSASAGSGSSIHTLCNTV